MVQITLPCVSPPLLLLTLFAVLTIAITARLLMILPLRRPRPKPRRRRDGSEPLRILIVLGSGGHTAEMLTMLRKVNLCDFALRSWVVSSGDQVSVGQAEELEWELHRVQSGSNGTVDSMEDGTSHFIQKKGSGTRKEQARGSYNMSVVPRARNIHQPLITTPFSALRCLWTCFDLLLPTRVPSGKVETHVRLGYPDLILTNGPGTAVIVVLASLVLRFFDFYGANSSGKMRTIYIESWARVKHLSLSGRILVWVVDRFLVQWEGLEGVGGGKGEFIGVLI